VAANLTGSVRRFILPGRADQPVLERLAGGCAAGGGTLAVCAAGRWLSRLGYGLIWRGPPSPRPRTLCASRSACCGPEPASNAAPLNRILGGTAVAADVYGGWRVSRLAGDRRGVAAAGLDGWLLLMICARCPRCLRTSRTPGADRRRRGLFHRRAHLGRLLGFGIDCSGYAQRFHRLRAWPSLAMPIQQFAAGRPWNSISARRPAVLRRGSRAKHARSPTSPKFGRVAHHPLLALS